MGEQKRVVSHSADCGEAPRWEFGACLQKKRRGKKKGYSWEVVEGKGMGKVRKEKGKADEGQ